MFNLIRRGFFGSLAALSPSSGGGGGGGGPGPFNFDFVGHSYSVNSTTVTASAIVDTPGAIDSTGLVMADSANVIGIIGDALTYLLTANWTMVIEWDHFLSTNSVKPFVMADGSNDNAVQVQRQNSLGSYFMNLSDFAGVNFRQATDSSAAIGDGQHKIALTRTNGKIVFSVDGRSVVSDTSISFGISPTAAAFGGYPGDTVFDAITIKSCVVTAPVSDASLPGLSA